MSLKPYALALDFGGTKLASTIVDLTSGKLLGLQKRSTPVQMGAETCLNLMIQTAEDSIRKAGVRLSQLNSIGISFGGPVSTDGLSVVRSVHVFGWENYPLAQEVRRYFGLPVIIANDGNAAALGEWVYGSLTEPQNFLYVQISTGIGAGLILNRELYTAGGLSAEFGHLKVCSFTGVGLTCSCGGTGCIEAIASGWALARDAEELYRRSSSDSLFLRIADQESEKSAKILATAARAGDTDALKILQNAFRAFTFTLGNCAILLDLDEIAIGGGVAANAWDILQPQIEAHFDETLPDFMRGRTKIRRAQMNGTETLLGAARLSLNID